jgi:hypothetical protein
MPSAIELIVNAYVKLGNEQALMDLIAHRERLIPELQNRGPSDFDFATPLAELRDEISVAQAGLDRIRAGRQRDR